jgi:nitrate reductase NapD
MNISSIVIQAKPEYVEEIIAVCEANDFCDYHFHDVEKGKIVVTIEGKDIDEEMSKMKKIEQIPHVICADMMMASMFKSDSLQLRSSLKLEITAKIQV